MHRRTHSGFTLIELITVMAIITLLAGTLGVAMRDGSPTVALEAAQATVAELLRVARGQAIANQSRAMLVVDAEPGSARFLRTIHVAVETSPASGQWRLAGDEAILPRGIFVVPGSGALPGVTFPQADGDIDWPDGRRSTLELTSPGSLSPSPENPSGRYLGMLAPLTAAGTAGRDESGKLVVAPARQTVDAVIFDRSESVRGVAISAYGAPILINDGPGLDF